MEKDDKETAKNLLGFQTVPFYVILNEEGIITQMGNKVNLAEFMPTPSPVISSPKTKTTEPKTMDSPSDVRAFVLEDLDF